MTPYDKLKTITEPTRVAVYKNRNLVRVRKISPDRNTRATYRNANGNSETKCCWFDDDESFSENINNMERHDKGRGLTIMILSAGQIVPDVLPETQSGEPDGIIERLERRINELESQVRGSRQESAPNIKVLFITRDGFEKETLMHEREVRPHYVTPRFETDDPRAFRDMSSLQMAERGVRNFRLIFRNEFRAIFAEVR